MTTRYDDDAFKDVFDSAVVEMHERMPRGNQPSARVWSQIEVNAGIREAGSDVPIRALRTTESPVATADLNLARSDSSRINRVNSHTGWTTWVAAALIIALLGANIHFWQPEKSNQDIFDSVAFAPGTPEQSALVVPGIATPAASPTAYIPVYGPEFACNVEPLTEDEVYQIVLNPYNGWVFKDSSLDTYERALSEGQERWSHLEMESNARSSYVAVDDPSVTQPIMETANVFWNCIMTGTAFQVWSLMDPEVVQHEILHQHPVLRDEAMLRSHIKDWGPRKYSAGLYMAFPDMGNTPPINASMHANESYGAVRMGYDHEGNPWKAAVSMVSHPGADYYRQRDLLLVRAPDGTWWISAIFFD